LLYIYKLFPFNRGANITCGFRKYLKQCKKAPYCCPIGAICDQ